MASVASANQIGDFVLFGLNGVDVGTGTRVYRGDVGSNGFVRGRRDAWIGGDAVADFVSLDLNSMVSGNVRSNSVRLGQGVRIGGQLISPLALPVFNALPALPAARPGENDIRVEDGGRRVLRAGRYGRIEIGAGARLVFTGGEVHAELLLGDAGAEVWFLRPTLLNLASGLQLGADCVLGGRAPTSAGKGVVHLSGPGLIQLRERCHVRANLVAPEGFVTLYRGSELTGAILARTMIIGDEVVLDHAPAFDPSFELEEPCRRGKPAGPGRHAARPQPSNESPARIDVRAWTAGERSKRCQRSRGPRSLP